MRALAAVAFELLLLLCSIAAAADELPRVLVFDTGTAPAPAGFIQALKIQLAGRASFAPGGQVDGSLAERLDGVSASLAARQAVVGLWLERITGPSDETPEFLVHVVSRRHDRVLVQVVRLPGPESPETDRALALKVKEVLNSVLSARDADLAVAVVERPRPSQQALREPLHVAPVLEAGLLGWSSGNGNGDEQLGAAAGVGARLAGAGWQAEAMLRGGIASGASVQRAGRSVETREVVALSALRVLLASRMVAAGAHAAAGLRIVQATGETADGRSGEATRLVPMLMLGPEVRAAFGAKVSLRAATGMELALRRQRFAVRGEVVSELATLRAIAELMLVVSLD